MGSLMGLRIEQQRVDDFTAILELHGELDAFTAIRARDVMIDLVRQGCVQLVLNLRGMEFIDSTGLSVLIGTLRRAREQGGGIRLVAPVRHVRRLFEITRLTLALPIDATNEIALAHLQHDAVPPGQAAV